MSRTDDLDQLEDIERYDYCHVHGDPDLIKVRVTLDLVVSRAEWNNDWLTGTDPQMVRGDVQKRVKHLVENPNDDDPLAPIRSVRIRSNAAVAMIRRLGLPRPR